jgi:hypothetical protein
MWRTDFDPNLVKIAILGSQGKNHPLEKFCGAGVAETNFGAILERNWCLTRFLGEVPIYRAYLEKPRFKLNTKNDFWGGGRGEIQCFLVIWDWNRKK